MSTSFKLSPFAGSDLLSDVRPNQFVKAYQVCWNFAKDVYNAGLILCVGEKTVQRFAQIQIAVLSVIHCHNYQESQ